jgi:hypothetical protein
MAETVAGEKKRATDRNNDFFENYLRHGHILPEPNSSGVLQLRHRVASESFPILTRK